MPEHKPRRAAGPAQVGPARGARFALGVVAALAALIGLGLVALGLWVLIPAGAGGLGLLIAVGGAILASVGVIGVLVGVVVAIRGSAEVQGEHTEMGSMVGNFVEDEDEDDGAGFA